MIETVVFSIIITIVVSGIVVILIGLRKENLDKEDFKWRVE